MKKQVLLVEDHEHLALALRLTMDRDPRFQTCGVAGDLPDALALVGRIPIDLVIVDLKLPSGSGLDLIPQLRELDPSARYLVLSQEDPAVFGAAARAVGASGYLRKGVPSAVILEAAASLIAGGECFPPGGGL